MKTNKDNKEKGKADTGKSTRSDEGSGQAGNFGSDGDMGTNYSASPGRTSPAVSANDTHQKKKKKTQR